MYPAEPIQRRDDHPGDGATRGTARLEYFADAVFAIALTLPVVSIELPTGRPLDAELAALWPSYLGYLISTLVVGGYWIQHHFSGALFETTSHRFNVATLLFLATIGFVAFPSWTFAEYLAEPAERATAAQFLVLALAAVAVAWLVKWATGCRNGHLDTRLDPAYVARLSRRTRAGALLSALALALTFAWWPGGLALAAAVALTQLLPMETPRYRTASPEVEGEG